MMPLLFALFSAWLAPGPWRMDAHNNVIPQSATSFDCTRATGRAERLICGDRSLAIADGRVGELYTLLRQHAAPARRTMLRQEQRAWLTARNRCADRACLERHYNRRATRLEQELARVDAALRINVARVGQCETTRIDWLGARFAPVAGEPLQGTSIGFANGVRQVSYARESQALRSRLGDPVRVCLVSIPRQCPTGDVRGRVYSARNLRTGARWSLPDSSHSCGGA